MSSTVATFDAPATADRISLWALATGSAISNFGNMLTFLAIPWFVLATTGSAAKTGLAGAAVALAPVATGLNGGPLVDRLGNGPFSAMAMVLIQTRVPERMLGRVMGLVVELAWAAGPLGMLLAGVAIDAVGLDATLFGVAALMTLIPVWLALNPRARAAAGEFDRLAAPQPQPAPAQ